MDEMECILIPLSHLFPHRSSHIKIIQNFIFEKSETLVQERDSSLSSQMTKRFDKSYFRILCLHIIAYNSAGDNN